MKPPVHLEGHGFLTEDGRYYPERVVRDALLAICEWWTAMTPAEQTAVSQFAHLAAIDQEVDAAVFGSDE